MGVMSEINMLWQLLVNALFIIKETIEISQECMRREQLTTVRFGKDGSAISAMLWAFNKHRVNWK